jgi:hypothetical protein
MNKWPNFMADGHTDDDVIVRCSYEVSSRSRKSRVPLRILLIIHYKVITFFSQLFQDKCK